MFLGGASTGSFYIDKDAKAGIFNGTVRNVSFLHAPGFTKVTKNHLPNSELNIHPVSQGYNKRIAAQKSRIQRRIIAFSQPNGDMAG